MKSFFLLIIIIRCSTISFAQSDKGTDTTSTAKNSGSVLKKTLAKASNPWNGSISLNLHNYYIPKLQKTSEAGNTLLLRGVKTTKRHMVRATLPFITVPTIKGYVSGIGNINIFDAIRITGDSAKTHLGIGPLISIPTASKGVVDNINWQFGGVALTMHKIKEQAFIGALATYRKSLEKNTGGGYLAIQPILLLNMGKGIYGRSFGTTCIFDFNNKSTLIPIGLGIGKLFKVENTIVNMFIEPGFTVYGKGENIPLYQLLMGIDFIWASNKR